MRDPFKKLTTVFQMSEEMFFLHYGKDGCNRHVLIDECRELFGEIYEQIPELPFCNIWTAMQLSSRLPKGALFHMGVSNTRRCWNMFQLPESVESACNVGCCGIDGCVSTLVGASLVNPDRLCYVVVGDLTFFYDLNSLGNHHIGTNLRVMLVNNGRGTEFRLGIHHCNVFGDDADKYMAAAGHFGNKSPLLVKHYAEDLGFHYLSATTKEEFMTALSNFTNPQLSDHSMILEVFTDSKDESEALYLMSHIQSDAKGMVRSKLKDAVRNVAGEKGINAIKKILKK